MEAHDCCKREEQYENTDQERRPQKRVDQRVLVQTRHHQAAVSCACAPVIGCTTFFSALPLRHEASRFSSSMSKLQELFNRTHGIERGLGYSDHLRYYLCCRPTAPHCVEAAKVHVVSPVIVETTYAAAS